VYGTYRALGNNIGSLAKWHRFHSYQRLKIRRGKGPRGNNSRGGADLMDYGRQIDHLEIRASAPYPRFRIHSKKPGCTVLTDS
jgi:hypothetical protein